MRERRPSGTLKPLFLRALLNHPPGEWVKGPVLAEAIGRAKVDRHLTAQVRGLVETRMGKYGGFRLTDRGRRAAQQLQQEASCSKPT